MVASKPAAAALVIAFTLVRAVAPLAAGDPPGNSPMSYVGPLPQFRTGVIFSLWANAWGGQGGVVAVELWYQKDGGAWQRYGDPIPYPWSWQFNTSSTGGDGRYGFYSIAIDEAGNREAPPPVPDTNITVDTVAPTSILDPLPAYTAELHINISARATDATSGVTAVRLYYSRTGQPESYWRYGPDFAVVGDRYLWTFAADVVARSTGGQGPFYFFTRALDAAGNLEPTPGAPGASTIVDTLAPTGSLDTRLNRYTLTSAITLTGHVADANGVAKVELWYMRGGNAWTIYGPAIPDPDGAVAWRFDTRAAGGDGTYRFMLVALDPAGNRLSLEGPSTTVDITPPALTINTPKQGEVQRSGIVTIAWGATDEASGVDHYEVSVDGGPFVNVGLNVKQLLRDLPDGPHSATIRAYDRAGNVAEARLSYTVDTGVPALGGAPLGLTLLAGLGAAGAALALLAWRRRRKPIRKNSPRP